MDIRDIVLRSLLNGEFLDKKISEKTGISLIEIGQAVERIMMENDWIIYTNTFSGKHIQIKGDLGKDIKEFIDNGGFSKIEYNKPVTEEEKIALLNEAYDGNRNEYSIHDNDLKYEYCRVRKIIESLIVTKHLIRLNGNKVFSDFKITEELGIQSVHENKMVYKKEMGFVQNYTINQTGDGNPTIGENRSIVNKTIREKESGHKNWSQNAIEFLKNNWLTIILAAIILTAVILKHIFHIDIGI